MIKGYDKGKDRSNGRVHARSKPGKREMNIHKGIEQAALELSEKKGKINGKDTDNWIEAERIVAKWQKDKSGR